MLNVARLEIIHTLICFITVAELGHPTFFFSKFLSQDLEILSQDLEIGCQDLKIIFSGSRDRKSGSRDNFLRIST